MIRRVPMIKRREGKDWTQDVLAEKAYCSRGLISNIERGAALPSLPIAISIAKALETSVEEIFFDINAQKVSRRGRKKIMKGARKNEQQTQSENLSIETPV